MTIWLTKEEHECIEKTIKRAGEIKKWYDAYIKKLVLERDMHVNRNRRMYKDLSKVVKGKYEFTR